LPSASGVEQRSLWLVYIEGNVYLVEGKVYYVEGVSIGLV
jgi:hypothetical protein